MTRCVGVPLSAYSTPHEPAVITSSARASRVGGSQSSQVTSVRARSIPFASCAWHFHVYWCPSQPKLLHWIADGSSAASYAGPTLDICGTTDRRPAVISPARSTIDCTSRYATGDSAATLAITITKNTNQLAMCFTFIFYFYFKEKLRMDDVIALPTYLTKIHNFLSL